MVRDEYAPVEVVIVVIIRLMSESRLFIDLLLLASVISLVHWGRVWVRSVFQFESFFEKSEVRPNFVRRRSFIVF